MGLASKSQEARSDQEVAAAAPFRGRTDHARDTKPPNPQIIKVSSKWLKSDFWPSGKSDPKVTQHVPFSEGNVTFQVTFTRRPKVTFESLLGSLHYLGVPALGGTGGHKYSHSPNQLPQGGQRVSNNISLRSLLSTLGIWGRAQMGSDGFNRILTGFYLFNPVRVCLAPLKTHDFRGFRPGFNRILTGL